ncbi:MAG: hypothetical protein U5L09_09525 [Bacteroidales bacterium]|nr:hypothetical protein [Bacteroidales bacterium]
MDNPQSNHDLQHLIRENTERIKELAAINKTTAILSEGKPVSETLSKLCKILPQAWQYPQYTTARIRFESKEYATPILKPHDGTRNNASILSIIKQGTSRYITPKNLSPSTKDLSFQKNAT